MLECNDVSEFISAYVDQELSEGEMAGVQTHLTNCESCRALVEEFASLSLLTRNAFSELSAPEWIESGVMQQITAMRQAKQSFRLMWVAVCSAVVMTGFAISGGFAAVWSFCWALVRLMFHLAHGIDVLLIRLVLGQGWLVTGTVVVGIAVTVMSMFGIRRMMRTPLDPRLGSS